MEVAMFLSDHRDLATVIKIYRAVDPKEAQRAMELITGKIKSPEKFSVIVKTSSYQLERSSA